MPKEGIERFGGELISRSEAVSVLETIRFKNKVGYTEVQVTPNKEEGGDFNISYIVTEPKDQEGKGYGKNAVKNIIDYARSKRAGRVLASVTADSTPFWRKCGFKKLRNSDAYYVYKV